MTDNTQGNSKSVTSADTTTDATATTGATTQAVDHSKIDADYLAMSEKMKKATFVGERFLARRQNSIPTNISSTTPKKNRNAFRHGMYSDEVVAPWESPKEFDDLYAELKNEWRPAKGTEEETLFALAQAMWVGRRVVKMPQLSLYSDPFARSLAQSGKTSWQDILAYQAAASENAEDALASIASAVSGLDVLATKLGQTQYNTASAEDKDTQLKDLHLRHQASVAMETLKKTLPQIDELAKIVLGDKKQFLQAYDPEWLDRQGRTAAANDARVDKLIKRLIFLQECRYLKASRPQLPAPTGGSTSGSSGMAVPATETEQMERKDN